jgi:pimeloyl-ACP methyl ester carboxylesterase
MDLFSRPTRDDDAGRAETSRGPLGALLYGSEMAFGCLWMLGELAVLATRPHELASDPHWHPVVADIERRGWYVPLEGGDLARVGKRGDWIAGPNPYQRVGGGPPDRILARFVSGGGPARDRRLLVVFHCYGIPIPPLMERLFGLGKLQDVDVVYNITNHHAPGTFAVWPGTGFARARLSHALENVRSAVTGARSLVDWLSRQRDYRRVTVLGYSLGGQLALHLANSAPIDRAILYCPVINLRIVARELGLGILGRPLEIAARRCLPGVDLELADHADPLRYPLTVAETDIHVIAQRHDALTRLAHVGAIRKKYPGVAFHEHEGTHLYPAGRAVFQKMIRELV